MFFDKKAKILTNESVSDGMGGWLDSGEPIELGEIDVAKAPVTAELALKEYGIVTTNSMKLYTESHIPKGDIYIQFENEDYRILQVSDYDSEKILLVEGM